jgi:hypothetical protein
MYKLSTSNGLVHYWFSVNGVSSSCGSRRSETSKASPRGSEIFVRGLHVTTNLQIGLP